MDDGSIFDEHRGLLFGVAYRMLGSVQEAEDVVQDAYLRWRETDKARVENPRAFLTTIVTRLSIDVLRSARKRREQYVGEWLPEPFVADKTHPADGLELAESLSTAFLLMLERLNPTERAAFLLREVFDYPYEHIAEMLGKTEANCRQIVKRAKQRVQTAHRRFEAPREEHERLVTGFIAAVNSGDAEAIAGLLTEDAAFHADHGGKVAANKRMIVGADKIGRFMVGIQTRFAPENLQARVATVNGRMGVIVYEGDRPYTAFSFETESGRIAAIYSMRNPDKLAHLPRPDDIGSALR